LKQIVSKDEKGVKVLPRTTSKYKPDYFVRHYTSAIKCRENLELRPQRFSAEE